MGNNNRLIAVVGATGAQGGGLARNILKDKASGFSVRALTRNPGSEKARELARLGAEIVKADVDDQKSLEKAFQGAYGAFCVTFFWEHFSPERDFAQASALAKAARAAGVEHAIWSTLEDTRKWVPLNDNRMPTLKAKYKVPHFDAKGEADSVFRGLGVPTTFLLTSYYWENLIYFGMGPKRGANGKLAITMPMGDRKLPGIASDDIGKAALGIFKRGREFIGRTVGIAGEHLSGAQMAAALTEALGEEVVYNEVSPDVYRGLGFPGADDLGNMFQFNRDFSDYYCSARNIDFTRSLNPELLTFREWLRRYKQLIPVERKSMSAS